MVRDVRRPQYGNLKGAPSCPCYAQLNIYAISHDSTSAIASRHCAQNYLESRPAVFLGMQAMDVALAWDADPMVRSRLREHGRLLLKAVPGKTTPEAPQPNEAVPKTVANSRANDFVLGFILRIMADSPGLKLPCIDKLNEAIQLLYQFNKIEASVATIYQDAWAVRRLLQLVKSRLYKPSPPKDLFGKIMLAPPGKA